MSEGASLLLRGLDDLINRMEDSDKIVMLYYQKLYLKLCIRYFELIDPRIIAEHFYSKHLENHSAELPVEDTDPDSIVVDMMKENYDLQKKLKDMLIHVPTVSQTTKESFRNLRM